MIPLHLVAMMYKMCITKHFMTDLRNQEGLSTSWFICPTCAPSKIGTSNYPDFLGSAIILKGVHTTGSAVTTTWMLPQENNQNYVATYIAVLFLIAKFKVIKM